MSSFGNPKFDEWMLSKDVPVGNLTRYNTFFLREIKDCITQNKRSCAMLYFLTIELKVGNLRTLFSSTMRQGAFMVAYKLRVMERQISPEYVPWHKKEIKMLRDRQNYISGIIKENLRLSEYYPFFLEKGFDALSDFELNEDVDAQLIHLKNDFDSFKRNNPDTVAKHMMEVQPEIDRIKELEAKGRADTLAERKAAREKRKAENAEIKEIKANAAKRRKRLEKIEKEMRIRD